MIRIALWALPILFFSISCKKNAKLKKPIKDESFQILESEMVMPVSGYSQAVDAAPQMRSPMPGTGLIDPYGDALRNALPPVLAVPPDAYGDDDIEDFFDSPRVFAVPISVCGNGLVESLEQCDDGNFDNMDGCNVICLFPRCGNGLLEKYEQCDDNNNDNADGCTQDCLYEFCGNGRIDQLPLPLKVVDTETTEITIFEECDDGNNKGGDGCSPCCLREVCGNFIIDPGEQCDDGQNGSSRCTSSCQLIPAVPPY